MKKQINRSFALAMSTAWLATVCLLGCGGADISDDQTPRETPFVHDDAPDPDRLVDAPCGEPDWSEPPPDVVSLDEAQD